MAKLLVVAPIVLVVVGFILLRNYEVLEKQPVPGATDSYLYRIRLFDAVTFKAEPDVIPSLDIVNTYVLVVASTLSLATAFLLNLTTRRPPSLHFFVMVGVGSLWLAADELLGGHETIGNNATFLGDLFHASHPDDPVIVIYVLIGLAIVIAYRRVILEARNAMKFFGAAVAALAVAAAADSLSVAALEEPVEVLGSLLGLMGFGALALHHLHAAGIVPSVAPTNHESANLVDSSHG